MPSPTIATTMPMTSHMRWPVMKLPGITPDPCRIHTAPATIPITPTTTLPICMHVHYALALHTSSREPEVRQRDDAPRQRAAARWPLRFRGDGLGANGEFLASAAAGLDLGQSQLPDVEPLNGREVAERAQEVLAAAPLHDAAELVLQTLDAFHEGDAEGIGDPCPLRPELLLDELLGIARQTFIADDHAFSRLDPGDLGVERIGVRQVELAILELDQHEVA